MAKKGDITYVAKPPYRHYGIAVGDGTVVHFVGTNMFMSGTDARIRHTSMSEFSDGMTVDIDEYANSCACHDPALLLV